MLNSKYKLLLFLLMIGFVWGLNRAEASENTATILGVVQDQTRAVLPGVSVTARNLQTNLTRSVVSDESGLYRIPLLPVGTYEVTAELAGFKKFVQTGIELTINQQARIDITLEVGEISDVISVVGEAPLVETEKPAVSGLVDSKRVVDLPLNGRNPLQLAFVLPGVVPPEPGAVSAFNFSVSGQRGQANNFLLDGGDNNDLAANFPSSNPNPDAVQEFRILKNSHTAEFGRNSGAVINVITKSGSNEFHGNLFEFHRNTPLNTRNFFDIEKPLFIQNQFGGTVGGPIFKDRTFFFGSYQGTRNRQGITTSAVTVPTPLERNGDFSRSARRPIDPLTRQPFPGGVIPRERLNPVAMTLLERFVPLPNLGANQFTANPPQQLRADQWLLKIDQNLGEKHAFYARYFFNDQSTLAPFAFGGANLPGFGTTTDSRTNSITLNLSSIFTPKQINEFRFTFQRLSLLGVVPLNKTTPQELGFTGINSQFPAFAGVPFNSVSGFFTLGNSVQGPQGRNDNTFQWIDNFNFIHGGHSIKLGVDIRRFQQNQIFVFNNNGFLFFSGLFTGNALSDFMLGLPFLYQQNATPTQNYRSSSFNFYFQDDWKVRRNFTFNFGIRYELNTPTIDKFDRIASFRPGQQSRVFPKAPPGLVFVGDEGVERATIPTDKLDWGPRVGFAWDPFGDGKTSIRAGYGVYYDIPVTELQLQFLVVQPFALQVLRVGNVASMANPFGSDPNPFPFPGPRGPETTFVLPLSGTFLSPDFRTPYSQQYNFTIQRELARDLKVEAAYVGSRGTKLLRRRQGNPAIFGPGATAGNIQQRRIFHPFYSGMTFQETVANSNYNSLQLSVEKRYSQGFALLGAYTLSKSIDNNSSLRFGAPQDPFNPGLDRGLSDFDMTHRLVISYLWELPFFKNQAGPLGRLLGGWQIGGITTFSSGFPFTVVTGADRSLRGVGADRPNLIGDPRLPTGRPTGELVAKYFNTSAFEPNGPGQNGTAGRNILRGPGFNNFDFTVIKRTKLPGLESHFVQFRVEFFNLFNHPNFFNPVSNLASPNNGRILSARDPRIIQFALKYEF